MSIVIQGKCDQHFSAIEHTFLENFVKWDEVGAAVAVYLHGRCVVDLWAGFVDAQKSRLWRHDTLVNVWSATKPMAALCALRLIDQGKLDLDTPVAHYWPEFAQGGKEMIPIRHLLSHQAGLAAIREPLPKEAWFDWHKVTQALAAQEPWWMPGEGFGYHAVTFGWLIGEVVRRVSGKRIGVFFQEEIAEPLGVDFLIGFGPDQDERVADIILPQLEIDTFDPSEEETIIDPNSIQAKLNNPPFPLDDPAFFNSRAWRGAEIPSGNGTTHARALARLYETLADGGKLDGFQLLSSDLLKQATQVASEGIDLISGSYNCLGLGFILNQPPGSFGPHASAFGHAGWGGAIGFADPKVGIGFGYTMNRLHLDSDPDLRAARLIEALYTSL